MRKSGILLHISSLPDKYGIGSFGKAAYHFVDKLKGKAIILADTASRTYKLWRLTISVIFHICRKSVLYRS